MTNRPDLPNHRQFVVSTVALLLLNLAVAPITWLGIIFAMILRNAGGNRHLPQNHGKATVLINGAKMYKALGMIRALGQSGCRVIAVEQGFDGHFAGSRFSRYVSKFHTLPLVQPGKPETSAAYIAALVKIALEEGVTIFVPCSGAGTTIEDAKAAEIMRARSGGTFRAIITSPELTKVLHEKDLFMDLLAELNVPRPFSKNVKSPAEALQVIKEAGTPCIMKATAVLDDLGRNDMTLYPLKNDKAPRYPLTVQRLESGLSVPISRETPYVVQQFIKGDEWCTHATVFDNRLLAFACCPSNDMLMLYEDWTRTPIGKMARAWTEKLLKAWRSSERGKNESFTGHLSMDFIRSKEDGTLYPIECNPRVHTAICLLANVADFARAYVEPAAVRHPALPPEKVSPRSWAGHDLPALLLPTVLPLLSIIHPYAQNSIGSLRLGNKDPTFDRRDPLPFIAFYHIQWPYLLVKQLFIKRKRWARINVSTSRIFEF